MTIGQAIRAVRDSAGMKQEQVVEKVRMDQPRLSRLELDKLTPTIEELAELESAMGVPRGRILIMAGYVEETASVPQAIAGDQTLNQEARDALLLTYRSVTHYLAHGGPP